VCHSHLDSVIDVGGAEERSNRTEKLLAIRRRICRDVRQKSRGVEEPVAVERCRPGDSTSSDLECFVTSVWSVRTLLAVARGPTSVAASSGSPMVNASIAATNLHSNSSAISSATIKRFAARRIRTDDLLLVG
jgi:hypothetical protein